MNTSLTNRFSLLLKGKPLDLHIKDKIYLRILRCCKEHFHLRLVELGEYDNSCSSPLDEKIIERLFKDDDTFKIKIIKEMHSVYGFNNAVIEDIYDLLDYTENFESVELKV